ISRNLADGTKARFLAEAGIEQALDTLTSNINGDWHTYLSGATCTTDTTGVVFGTANTALPGLTTASGTYTVDIRNDCQANDAMNGNLTTGTNMLGISVGPENQFVSTGGPTMQHATQIQISLMPSQKADINGMNQTNPSTTTTGDNTIAASALTSAAVTDFV